MRQKDMASMGGKARAKKLSKERRKEIAVLAIGARWGKKIDKIKRSRVTV